MTLPASLKGFYASPVALNTEKKWIVAVVGRDILLADAAGVAKDPIINSDATDKLRFFCQRKISIGQWLARDCEVWELMPEVAATEGFTVISLRDVLMVAGEEIFALACRAVQLLDWQDTHRFCGRCGEPNKASDKEHALTCDGCNINNYPRISPCVIVLVTRGDHCLLARNHSWPVNRFSAVAGYLEAGESAEHALHREVFEEVGVEIDNIRYIGSQSWPYPGQLMLGFIANAVTDKITVDGIEIAEARWFRYDQLPGTTAPIGIIAGRLVQQYVAEATEAFG